jgi:hypothetical protein
MSRTKQSKQSNPVHPNTAETPVAPKATRRKRMTSTTALPLVHATLPVVQIPAATGDPAVTLPATSSTRTTAIPLSSGTTPATPTPSAPGSSTSTPASPTVANEPPVVVIPEVPDNFTAPTTMRGFKGYYPNKSELAALPGALSDLGNFAEYATVLGNTAPPASAVTSTVSVGMSWRQLRISTEAWDAYVKTQDAIAWKAAVTLLDEVKVLFLYAVSKNATLATKYPSLLAYFNVSKETAAQGSVTRKKNAKTKAAAALVAATAAGEAAGKAATTPAVTPSKGITFTA